MTMRRIIVIILALVASVGVTHAQDDSTAASKIPIARRLFKEAVEAVRQEKWELAREKFRKSYELAPRVLTLLNLGGAQFETGRYVEAAESYSRFLRQTDDGRYPNERRDARKQLERIDSRLAYATIVVRNLAAGDVLTIDGVVFPSSVLGEPLTLNPGTHRVAVKRGDKPIASRRIELVPGASRTIRLTVEAAAKRRGEPATTAETPSNNPPGDLRPPPTGAAEATNKASTSSRLVIVISRGAGVARLSAAQIRNVYLGKTKYWQNGKPVRAYRRAGNSVAGKKLFAQVIRMRSIEYKLHWDRLQLSGGGLPPRVIRSPKKMFSTIKGSASAIGIMLESELPAQLSGVRVIRF